MKRLLCALFGHRHVIVGLTGRYKWCTRCAHRIEAAPPPQQEEGQNR